MSKRKREDSPKVRLESEQELNVAWHSTVAPRDPLMSDDFPIHIKTENIFDEMDIGDVQIEASSPPMLHTQKTICNIEQNIPQTSFAISTVSTKSQITGMPSIINDLKDVLAKMKNMNERIEYKMNRISQDVAEIKVDIFDIKSKVCGGHNNDPKYLAKPITPGNVIVPETQFKDADEFENFEESLKNKDIFNHAIHDFLRISERNIDKFVRQCWRKLFVDEVAENYSWRGTITKKCIKTSLTTLAIRHAYKRKFLTENDVDFDRLSQKFFQYAHDRVVKVLASKAKKEIFTS